MSREWHPVVTALLAVATALLLASLLGVQPGAGWHFWHAGLQPTHRIHPVPQLPTTGVQQRSPMLRLASSHVRHLRPAAGVRLFAQQRGLPDIVLSPTKEHTSTVIFLHGLGDTGYGWQDAMEAIQPLLPHTKFILPTAPQAPVTLNMGMKMPSWFDIKSLDDIGDEELEGLDETVSRVWNLIDTEVEDMKIPASRIVLGGFSQGGASAIYAGYTYKNALAGVMGLSSWLPRDGVFEKTANPITKDVPFLLCHGKDDEVVRFEFGEDCFKKLQGSGRNGEFQSFRALGHSLNMDELRAVAKWLTNRLP
eukprot:EG_transcript_18914